MPKALEKIFKPQMDDIRGLTVRQLVPGRNLLSVGSIKTFKHYKLDDLKDIPTELRIINDQKDMSVAVLVCGDSIQVKGADGSFKELKSGEFLVHSFAESPTTDTYLDFKLQALNADDVTKAHKPAQREVAKLRDSNFQIIWIGLSANLVSVDQWPIYIKSLELSASQELVYETKSAGALLYLLEGLLMTDQDRVLLPNQAAFLKGDRVVSFKANTSCKFAILEE